jgi:predicted nucleic acid-binding protein
VKLVDTSSWVEYLRDRESEASGRVEDLLLAGEASWCEMTLVELWNGARGTREKGGLAELEKEITLLPVPPPVWKTACKLARRCREAGITVPASDIVVAACAANHGVELEHCDDHFDKILPITVKL